MHTGKFLAGVTMMLMSMASLAQFSKGDRMVGAAIGSIFLNSGSSDVSFPQVRGYSSESNSYGLRIEPSFGWFVSEKMAWGASLLVNPRGEKISYNDAGTTFQRDESNSVAIGAGAFLRNYFGSSSSFMPFGQFGFTTGIQSSTTEGFKYYNSSPDYKVSYDGKSSGGFFLNALLQLGLTKMLGESTGLDITLGYNYSTSKNTFKTTTLTDMGIDGSIDTRAENEPTSKYTNHGIIVGVGFQVFLRGKRGK
jgi:hypothetical protein